MTREKMQQQINVRLPDDVVGTIDERVREREREARVPLKRAIIVREILLAWHEEQRSKRGRAA